MPRRSSPQEETEGKAAARTRRPTPPPDAAALTAIREALDIPQGELARLAGLSAGALNEMEAGTKPLKRPRFEEIVARIGLGPETIDEAIAFVLSIRAQARPSGLPLAGDPARPRQDALVLRVQAAAGGLARALLTCIDFEPARQEAVLLWGELKRQSPARRRALVEGGPRFRRWALCELVCQESLEAAADSAATAVELASLAVLIAELTPGPQDVRNQLQGYAHPHLGNAWRVHGKLPEANEEFALGKKLWTAGGKATKGMLNEARILGMEASLRLEQGQLTDALHLLDLAQEVDAGEETKSLLVSRARVLGVMQDFNSAIKTLLNVAPLIVEEHEPRLLWTVKFNLVDCLLHLHQSQEASEVLIELRRLTRKLGKQLDGLRLRWLEGRLAAALGKKEEASVILSGVRDEFAFLEMPFDTALATLELSLLLLEQGRNADVLRLARQLEKIFRAQGAHEKALEAVLIFRKAAERQAVTLELVRRLITFMERARYNPKLSFESD